MLYLNDHKLDCFRKVVHALTNINTYYNPTVVGGDNENDDQGINNTIYQERKCVGGNIAIVENSTILCRDDSIIAIDELYMLIDGIVH